MSDFIEFNYDDDLVKLRPDRIESIRPWNDGLTYIWMFSGDHFTVKESPQEIIAKIEEWKNVNDYQKYDSDAYNIYGICTPCGKQFRMCNKNNFILKMNEIGRFDQFCSVECARKKNETILNEKPIKSTTMLGDSQGTCLLCQGPYR